MRCSVSIMSGVVEGLKKGRLSGDRDVARRLLAKRLACKHAFEHELFVVAKK